MSTAFSLALSDYNNFIKVAHLSFFLLFRNSKVMIWINNFKRSVLWCQLFQNNMNIVKMEKSPARHHRDLKNPGKQSKEIAKHDSSLLRVPRNASKLPSRRFKVQADAYQLNVSKFFKEQLSETDIYTPEEPFRNKYRFVDKSKLPTEKILARIQRNLQRLNVKLNELQQYELSEEDQNEVYQQNTLSDVLLVLQDRKEGEKIVQSGRHIKNETCSQGYSFVVKKNKFSSNKTAVQ